MGQVAFDTQEFVETLEKSGLKKEQAKAISIAVRKSHEVVDVATKRDLEDAKKELSSEVTAVKRDLEDVRKDLTFQIADVRKDMEARFGKTDAQIALLRKDVEHIATGLLLKLGGVIVLTISAATAIMKFM